MTASGNGYVLVEDGRGIEEMIRKGDAMTPDHKNETQRYRQAAEDAIQQLDWCIGYLHGIRKIRISRSLSRNRSYIRQQLMHREEEPLPSSTSQE